MFNCIKIPKRSDITLVKCYSDVTVIGDMMEQHRAAVFDKSAQMFEKQSSGHTAKHADIPENTISVTQCVNLCKNGLF